MTNDEIRMKIAELKGCYWWEIDGVDYLCGMDHAAMLPKGAKKVDQPSDGYRHLYRVKNWPVSIADAWELVEEARLVIRPSFLNGKYVASCFLSVTLGGLVKSDFEVTADTAPRAISLAWIAWKESKG